MKDVTLGIIGGKGRMGDWLRNQFEEFGLTVLIADQDTPLSARDLGERCRVVIVSVPITVTEAVIAEVGPLMPEDSLLMDLTSNKTGPVEAMLRHSRSEVVGAHPLFGPREDSIKNRHIVLCPGRGEHWLEWIKALFEEMGAIVKVISPDHHDRLMAAGPGHKGQSVGSRGAGRLFHDLLQAPQTSNSQDTSPRRRSHSSHSDTQP
ncbi:MAG: prephenate dehydrogenase/arogenate dehydrogenase family protein [Deltaproteobacteria bacterium]|nr:prephenate dehydrogenase/arogenate dehydrogenase family protein [Deltaproteobacteria bacterium]